MSAIPPSERYDFSDLPRSERFDRNALVLELPTERAELRIFLVDPAGERPAAVWRSGQLSADSGPAAPNVTWLFRNVVRGRGHHAR